MTAILDDLDAYRIWLRNKMTPKTADQYYHTVSKMVSSIGKSTADITLNDVTVYIDGLYNAYPHVTVAKYADRIRSFLRFIEKDSIAYKMPVRKQVVSPDAPDSLDTIQFLPEDKIVRLLQHATSPAELAALQLGYHFAMRVNEVPLLKTSWINGSDRTLKIYRLKSKSPWQELPFDHDETDIHDTYGVIQSYLVYRSDRPSEYLVQPVNKSGRDMISFNALEQFFHRAVRRAAATDQFFAKLEEQGAAFHILRHSKTTNMIIHQMQNANSISLVKVTKWAHHSDYNTTLRYIHLAARYLGLQDIPVSTKM